MFRVETTINNPREFKVLRSPEDGTDQPPRWCPMGVANFWRYAEVAANGRLLTALARVPLTGEATVELDASTVMSIPGEELHTVLPLTRSVTAKKEFSSIRFCHNPLSIMKQKYGNFDLQRGSKLPKYRHCRISNSALDSAYIRPIHSSSKGQILLRPTSGLAQMTQVFSNKQAYVHCSTQACCRL